ncbi:MAG: hypothetical protein QOE77_3834 [Blastocatellia bacterium]|nr:hypothetical protein [Blastocatellia bacterium]
MKKVSDMTQVMIDGRLITDQADAGAAQEIKALLEKFFNTESDYCLFTSAHVFDSV